MGRGLVAVVLVTVAGCGADDGGSASPPGTTSSSSSVEQTTSTASETSTPVGTVAVEGGPAVATRETTESFESPALDVTLYVPVVSGIEPAAAAAINKRIDDEVGSRVSSFRRGVGAASPNDEGPPSSFVGRFEVTAATPEVLSMRFFESMYFQGAVSGVTAVYTQSFDPATGESLTLDDIIAPEAQPELAELAEQRLVEDFYAGDETELRSYTTGITPTMLQHWSLSSDGVEISFEAGQVGADHMGPLTIVVAYADLGGLIDPESPAAVLAAT